MENIIILMVNIIQEYEPNGNKIYEGGFINNNRDGIGKYYNEDGQYYIGQWKDDTSMGKGIMYYQNGKVKYDGDFANGVFEGYGKFYAENGEYYIGQFKNSLRHGKGTIYFPDGSVKYDGEFVNNMPKENVVPIKNYINYIN